MAQDCFLTFGICRQMIMMQPGKLSILPLESKQWGTVNSKTCINLPISATILRYTVLIWDNKDSSHFISVTGTADGYIQIVNANGVSTGTCFYLAITK